MDETGFRQFDLTVSQALSNTMLKCPVTQLPAHLRKDPEQEEGMAVLTVPFP